MRTHLPVLILSLLATTACSNDAEPRIADPTESTTSAASPSNTEQATPSQTPTSSPTTREVSAVAFVKRWIRAGDTMQKTGNTEKYLSMSANCTACNEYAQAIREIYEPGGRVDFAGTKIIDIELEGQNENSATVNYTVQIAEATVYLDDGSIDQVIPGGVQPAVANVRKTEGGWAVTSYGRTPG